MRVPEKSSASVPRGQMARRWLALVIVVIGCAGFVLTLVLNARVSALTAASPEQLMRAELNSTEVAGGGESFSTFTHANAAHARLPCLLCHKRESNAPQPKLPGHLPCAGCHIQEFANSGSPICAICHTNAQTGAMKSFPPLKSFNVSFDHARHTGAGRTRTGCATCHTPERRGLALSIPANLGAHATCFQCHAPRAEGRDGGDISSCSTCHNLGRLSRTPETAKAYKVNFSHAEHGPRQRLGCSDCHSVRAGMPQARQVTAPLAAMHKVSARAESCASCHNDKRAFGISNPKNCRICHEGQTFRL
jgi:c(7)-type cytochrome triheme protein